MKSSGKKQNKGTTMKKSIIALLLLITSINLSAQNTELRIAVMPFENLSKQKELAWISSGIADSLTQSLSCVTSLRMIERSQMGQIMEEQSLSMTGVIDDKKMIQTGKLLSANRLLTGTYQTTKNSILINLRVINTETGEVDKSKVISVNGDINKIFDLYEQLSVLIIERFSISAADAEKQNLAKTVRSTSSLKAYQEYSAGREAMLSFTEEAYKTAAEHFDNATIEDSTYALAYAALAEATALIAHEKKAAAEHINIYQESDNAEQTRKKEYESLFIKAQGYAKTAVSLAPSLPESHRAAAVTYYYMDDDTQAKIEAQTLMALNKNDPTGYYLTGSLEDDLDRGLKFINKALTLDPNFGRAYLDIGYYYETKGDFKRASEEYKKGTKTIPLNPDLNKALGLALFRIKDFKGSEQPLDKTLKYRPGDPYALLCAAVVKFKLGKSKEALTLFKKAYALNWNYYSFPSILKQNYKWDNDMIKEWGVLRDASEKK
jgi:adenylate cyclase